METNAELRERVTLLEAEKKLIAEKAIDKKQPPDFIGDKAGVGRYVLSFFMAGLVGIWAVYWARYYGWRGIWISGVLMALIWGLYIYDAATCQYPNC